MKRDGHTDRQIRTMLMSARRVAVVGMSRSTAKAAGQIPRYLAGCGYDVIPINPNADCICGRRSYASITEVSSYCKHGCYVSHLNYLFKHPDRTVR